ncbi:MAG: response regulator [Lachnospiraceae bacterium]|nr:response regulator [Lachnospiraceae bacterium]
MRNKVLVVDDVETNRDILEEMLKDNYEIVKAGDGDEALELIEKYQEEIAVVLLDLIMPKKDGYEVLEEMKNNKWMDKMPVLIISAEASVETETQCFDYGISDFIRKPFDGRMVKRRVRNIIDLFNYKNSLEEKVAEQTETLRKQYKILHKQAEELHQNKAKIIEILGTVVEYRNLESGEHINRVKGFTKIMAEKMMEKYPEYNLTPRDVEIISSAAALHDIGKIAIPDNILLKPGRLTPEEFDCMKTHTTRGCDILDSIEGAWDEEYGKVSYEICRYHHERHDGKGYPDGLKEDEIPISAQLVSVADVYDALVTERVYKHAIPKDEAFQMILDGKCGTFSPKLMECFKEVREDFEDLANRQK